MTYLWPKVLIIITQIVFHTFFAKSSFISYCIIIVLIFEKNIALNLFIYWWIKEEKLSYSLIYKIHSHTHTYVCVYVYIMYSICMCIHTQTVYVHLHRLCMGMIFPQSFQFRSGLSCLLSCLCWRNSSLLGSQKSVIVS